MKFLADESIDRQVVDRLRIDGHEVRYVTEMEPGISDDLVLSRANQEMAELVSTAITQHLPELENAFVVIVPGSIRIRRSDL
jgi:RecB family endonuclease NucS